LAQNTAPKILADTTSLATANDNYEQAKATLAQRQAVVNSVLKTSRDFLVLGRDVLKPTLGRSYSQAWTVTGFVHSLVVSKSAAPVQTQLRSFKSFFDSKPELQVDVKDITSARAEALGNSLSGAIDARNQQRSEVKTLLAARRTAQQTLRKRLRGTIHEVSQLIGLLDPRWLAFGLNQPGAEQTPEVPQGLTVTLFGPTAAAIKWTGAPRASYYRVWKKVAGVDTDFVRVGSPADRDFTLEELPSNKTVEIAVSAVNSGGESARSAVVTVVTQ
jgi:hypothetical protein